MISLIPMRSENYAPYIKAAIISYASDNVAAGRWLEAGALERSHADFEKLLPQGLSTPNHFLYEIVADGCGPVGFAWLAIERKHGAVSAFIYDIEIVPGARRQGHASRALEALESKAAAAGASAIALNVFANNHGAQALYQKLGYAPTHFQMRKPLGQKSA